MAEVPQRSSPSWPGERLAFLGLALFVGGCWVFPLRASGPAGLVLLILGASLNFAVEREVIRRRAHRVREGADLWWRTLARWQQAVAVAAYLALFLVVEVVLTRGLLLALSFVVGAAIGLFLALVVHFADAKVYMDYRRAKRRT